jgi:hypothetical protein
MAKVDFGTDPSKLEFSVKHDDDQTKLRVNGTDYSGGSVTFDASASSSIPLKIGNGSPTQWKLTQVNVILNPDSTSPISIPMEKQDDETWKGALLASDVTNLVDGSLHVKAQWEERSSGKKEPKEDPVIIVNPKPTP